MRKMKEKELAIEKSEWDKEILSDKNPNLVAFYKQKFDNKQNEVINFGLKIKHDRIRR